MIAAYVLVIGSLLLYGLRVYARRKELEQRRGDDGGAEEPQE